VGARGSLRPFTVVGLEVRGVRTPHHPRGAGQAGVVVGPSLSDHQIQAPAALAHKQEAPVVVLDLTGSDVGRAPDDQAEQEETSQNQERDAGC
jgi:hypothetical protein